jgi:hypothetical protein
MRLFAVLFIFLLSASLFGQEAQELKETFPEIIPFPVKNGWTFINDRDSAAQYPVYDSIVIREWEMSTIKPFIVIDSGRYGLMHVYPELDTLLTFDCDSIFQRGDHFFYRRNGSWFDSMWNLSDRIHEVKIGIADVWIDDGKSLFYKRNGKTGLHYDYRIHVEANYQYVQHLGAFDSGKLYMNRYRIEDNLFLVSDGRHFGVINSTNEVFVPLVAEGVELYKEQFLRYFDGYWKYLRLSDRKLIDPRGNDVVIYSSVCWKVYNATRTRSVLYLNGEQLAFSGNYDDCFVLPNGKIAVRANTLIGVANQNGKVEIACGWEQIDVLNEKCYRALKAGRWYLLDMHGRKLNQEGFDHIGFFSSEESAYFRIHRNGKVGVLATDGKVLFPAIYDDIAEYEGCFILDKEYQLAVGSSSGKMLSKHDFSDYYWDTVGLLVMQVSSGEEVVFLKSGPLNTIPCTQHFLSDDVLKAYSGKGLEIVVLENEQKVLERLFYPDISSAEVGEMPKLKWVNYHRIFYPKSFLEEHQLSGFYGYRHSWETDHIRIPDFREVVVGLNFGYDLGVQSYEDFSFVMNDSLQLTGKFRLQAIDPDNAEYVGNLYASSNIGMEASGGRAAENRMIFNEDGSQSWWFGSDNKLDIPAASVAKIDYSAPDLFACNIGGQLLPAANEPGSFSFFEQYRSFNTMGNLFPSGESIGWLMDPANRLRVSGGKWCVNIDFSLIPEKITEQLKDVCYDEVTFFNDWDEELGLYYGKPAGSSATILAFQRSDSIVLDQFREVKPVGYGYVSVTSSETRFGKVHPYNPSYVFVQRDSSLFYVNGRLLEKTITGWGLKSIGWEELVPAFQDEIRYLGYDRFGIRNVEGWRIIDRNGKWMSEMVFRNISDFDNGYAIFFSDHSLVVDTFLQPVMESVGGLIYFAGDGVYQFSLSEDKVIFDVESGITDTILASEKNLGKGWVFGKTPTVRYVRRAGITGPISVKCTSDPEVFGECLLLEKNGLYTLIDPRGNGVFPKNVRWSSFKKGDGIICLQTDKKWSFVSDEGVVVHECPKGKNVDFFKGRFFVEHKDTSYTIGRSGDSLGGFELPENNSVPRSSENGYKVVEQGGLYGVLSDNDKMLVDPVHTQIIGKSGEEFLVEVPSVKGIYDLTLNPVLPAIYDQIIGYNASYFYVFKGNAVGLCDVNGNWIRALGER